MSDVVYLPSPTGDDAGYISLSKTPQGRLIRKQILPMNASFVHPADKKTKIFVDKTMAQKLVDNFNADMSLVQVPIVNDANQHVEDPLRNAGEVIDLDYDDKGVYATIDARKYADDFGKTILGASAFLHLNYTDTKTGRKVGPTLLHVAATNRPYINGMDDYTDILKASADISDEQPILLMPEESGEEEIVTLSDDSKDGQMTLEEMLAALKAEHNIDVSALQAEAARAAELSGQLDSVNEQLQLSNTEAISVADLAEGLVELSNSNKALAAEVEELKNEKEALKLSAAETEVDELVKAGRVLPKQRDTMVRLSMTDRESFEALVPEKAIVSLSESGVTVHEDPDANAAREAAVSRYADMAARLGRPKSR